MKGDIRDSGETPQPKAKEVQALSSLARGLGGALKRRCPWQGDHSLAGAAQSPTQGVCRPLSGTQ
jgi:hypothetical protein